MITRNPPFAAGFSIDFFRDRSKVATVNPIKMIAEKGLKMIDTKKEHVFLLTPDRITLQVVEGVNSLLKRQHGRAFIADESYLRDFSQRSKIVVALREEKVVGIGTLVSIECLTHWYAAVHNFIVSSDQNIYDISKQMAALLSQAQDPGCEYIECGSGIDHPLMLDAFKDLGYVPKARSRYRLRLKR